MKIDTGDADVRVACGIANFGQSASASQSVADKRMPPVVDGQCLKPLASRHFTRRAELLSECVAGENQSCQILLTGI
jgi:hypothetical protein